MVKKLPVNPHSTGVETALLGAALLSDTALEVLATQVEPEDFFLPGNMLIATCMRKLYEQGHNKLDAILVSDELDRSGDLARVGGTAKLVEYITNCPSTSNAEKYAKIITDYAVRRRLVVAANEFTEEARDGESSLDELLEQAKKTFGTVEYPMSTSGPDQDVEEFLEGSEEYDWLVEGLFERKDRLIITGREGGGKALAVDTPIPTPKGWKTIMEISPGEQVFSPTGKPVEVLNSTGIMMGRPCYEVKFSDGSVLIADEVHQWIVEDYESRCKKRDQTKVVTTKELRDNLKARKGFCLNYSIEVCSPLEYSTQDLLIDPYILGVWLGDGTSDAAEITCADIEIIELLNVRGNKHIPDSYKYSSVEQRLALIQGLMDTDGTINEGDKQSGRGYGMTKCEFSVCNKRLAEDFFEVIISLGIKATLNVNPAKLYGEFKGLRYRIAFQTELPVFRLPRKLERIIPLKTNRAKLRYITSVESVPSVPVKCIQVEGEQYLAGKTCITTHNSTLNRQLAITLSAGIHPFKHYKLPGGPIKVLLIDLENSEIQTRRKMRSMVLQAQKLVDNYDPSNLRIRVKTDGLNLMERSQVRWLLERVEANQPDLLITGPLYKLHDGDMNDEGPAKKVSHVFDMIRTRYNCAIILEAHSPYTTGNGGKRLGRPYGASLWSRWPEFGYCISQNEESVDEYLLEPWRGPRDEREWPYTVVRGGSWPWTEPKRDEDF